MAPGPNPFEEMERLMEQLRRSAFNGVDTRAGGHAGANVSLETRDDGYVVLADLPGFEREELDLRYEDGVLTVSADHEADEYADAGAAHGSRRRHVHERVRLPAEVDEDAITASYRNGVLEVVLPAVEDADDEHVIDIE